ncbi:MAG TPA: glycosyltransferase family 4 protein [bacterium]|nr:glycosyltransferase family 4 protein [bacterium]HQL62790.1 glycosyltransferase family 4 protein [bacterium]
MNPQTLLVIIPDRLSELVSKGEITPRYYNPGNLFQNVHILMVNDDRVNPADLQETAGDANLTIHNYPADLHLFYRSLGWRPFFLRGWAEPAVRLAEEIRPALIRCHGNKLNGYLASRIKKALGIPYVVSIHINPDEDIKGRATTRQQRFYLRAMEAVGRVTLRNADLVMPVYQPIVPYLKRMGAERFEVVYNILNENHLQKKDDYRLHHPVRIVSVGRQIREKNPDNIIRAVQALPDTHLTLVGHGSYHEYLRNLVQELGLQDRVDFRPAVPNSELCSLLPEFDIFAVHTEYWEISKSVLEALLTGLPVVINRRVGEPVPELEGDFVLKVNNTVEEYTAALKRLIEDDIYREQLGRRAYEHAQEHWSPKKMEARVVEIYRKLMKPA